MPLAVTALAFLVAAAPPPPLPPDGDDPRSVAAAASNGSIEIDGRLSEAAWQEAPVASGFRQLEPDEGAPASQRTAVRVLYGETALYIGARMHDEAPERIRATLGRRDDENQADWFYVSIDSYFDRKTAYTFAVNAAGVQLDGQREERRLDESWDAIWYSAVQVDDGGWTAELRIPYTMLRFTEADVQTWGIQFRRKIPRLSETDEWALIPRTQRESGLVAHYGLLTGLHGIRLQRNLQVAPYTVSRLRTEEDAPGETRARGSFDAGADFKAGLSSNITLDATVNPDFGQVEADPATLNLSAFETFFEERRPFFVEGIQIFEFDLGRGSELLYTRRIGGEVPIVGAAKLSGRTAGGLSFGVLSATTGEDFDPERAYATARATQEIGTYSSAGGILTAFRGPGGAMQSLAAGMDWDLRFRENTYQLSGFASATHRRDDALVAQDAQTGFAAELEADRIQGTWTYGAGVQVFDDRFDPNDLGRLRRNNYLRLSGGLEHEINGGRPFGPFQRADAGLFAGQSWSYREGLSQGLGFFLRSNFQTRTFQEIEVDVDTDYLLGGYDLYETRGLDPRRQERRVGLGLEFETDSRRAWRLNPETDLNYRADGGLGYGLELDAEWALGDRLTLSGGIRYEREDNVTAWASNETFALTSDGWQIGEESLPPDELGEDPYRSFDGASSLTALLAPVAAYDAAGRYFVPIFGARDTRSLETTLRSGFTLTPDLSLEVYAQLFVAKGRYHDFRLLQDSETLAPFPAYPKRRDFSLRSFLSNAVLRWQFRPGSEVFLVWSQTRQEDLAPGPFDRTARSPFENATTDEIAGTFGIFPQNVFLLKVNYTFLR